MDAIFAVISNVDRISVVDFPLLFGLLRLRYLGLKSECLFTSTADMGNFVTLTLSQSRIFIIHVVYNMIRVSWIVLTLYCL